MKKHITKIYELHPEDPKGIRQITQRSEDYVPASMALGPAKVVRDNSSKWGGRILVRGRNQGDALQNLACYLLYGRS